MAEKAKDEKEEIKAQSKKTSKEANTTSKSEKPAGEEKILMINLRKELVGKPYWKRAKDAASILRGILKKKTKADKILISQSLNEKLWSRGIEKPSVKLRVKIIKDGDTARVELMEQAK